MIKKNIIFLLGTLLMIGNAYSQLSDPTRPVNLMNEMALPANSWTLNAIIIGKDRRVAVINDQAVSLGAVINGNRVSAIHRNAVELMNSAGTITLFLLDRSEMPKKHFYKGIKYDVSM